MKNLILPESSVERQEAYERILAQLLAKALLIFPTEEIDRELFLSMLREQYKNHERLSQSFNCKWGKINNPAKFIKNLKDKYWEYEGVQKHYNEFFQKLNSDDLEHLVRLWYVKFDLSEIKELVEQFFSDDEEKKNQATEILKGIGVDRLDHFLAEELGRIYRLPPLEFLEIYYQYFASTREENPVGERLFLAKIERIQGLLFDCICYDLIHANDELEEMRDEKLSELIKEPISIEEKIAILRKLLTLFPFHRYLKSEPGFPENPGYWLYAEVIETLGELGEEEAEKVLLEIVQGDFHHQETKEEASEQLRKIEEKRYLDQLPTLEDL